MLGEKSRRASDKLLDMVRDDGEIARLHQPQPTLGQIQITREPCGVQPRSELSVSHVHDGMGLPVA